jgi:hypothetical protein
MNMPPTGVFAVARLGLGADPAGAAVAAHAPVATRHLQLSLPRRLLLL